MINIIAAVGKNLELGLNNQLIWNLKGDMKYFRETTLGYTVVMGRKTYESIGRPLPNRRNIVITSKKIDGVETLTDPEKILSLEEDVFIIGSASIYEYFLPFADNLYLTEINEEHEADTYFPNFDKSNYEKVTIEKNIENGVEYTFVSFKRLLNKNNNFDNGNKILRKKYL